MSAITHDIVAKLWNLCNVLKDDGVTYHQRSLVARQEGVWQLPAARAPYFPITDRPGEAINAALPEWLPCRVTARPLPHRHFQVQRQARLTRPTRG